MHSWPDSGVRGQDEALNLPHNFISFEEAH